MGDDAGAGPPANVPHHDPLRAFVTNMRLSSEQFLHSDRSMAAVEYSRRLASGAAFFHALSLEMANRANTLAPVSRLPKEVLIIIATIASALDPPRPAQRNTARRSDHLIKAGAAFAPGHLGWIVLVHVCKTWRAILLNTKSLWAHNITALPRAVLAFIQLAGPTTPLAIEANLSQQLCVPSCRDIYAHIPFPRVRFMTWFLDSVEDTTYLHCNIARPENELPNLERLAISSSANPDPNALARAYPDIRTPRLPSLRVLTYERFYVSFATPNLTELSLSHVSIPLSRLLYDLGRVGPSPSRLTRIQLWECHLPPCPSPIVTRLTLPCLGLLVLAYCYTNVDEDFFGLLDEHVAFSASTKFNIKLHDYPEDVDDDEMRLHERGLYSAIRLCTHTLTLVGGNPAPNILTIEEGDLRLSFSDLEPNQNDAVWQEPCLPGSLILAQITHGCNALLENVLEDASTPAALGFYSVTVLNIIFGPWIPWERMFEALPNVTTLRLAAQNKDVLEVLGRVPTGADIVREDASPFESQLFLPKLSLLWVDDNIHRKRGDGECSDDIREPLLRALEARAEFSARAMKPAFHCLQTLYLQNFKTGMDGDSYLEKLRKVVSVVECFDTEYTMDSDDEYDRSLEFSRPTFS
ncbi:hypothetical protein PENSPDRAFT_758480 [Peniophora sp. CONT]|nr:hypothetical protein PENSPDRAFT_758480 [Peniophora sp. CONT]